MNFLNNASLSSKFILSITFYITWTEDDLINNSYRTTFIYVTNLWYLWGKIDQQQQRRQFLEFDKPFTYSFLYLDGKRIWRIKFGFTLGSTYKVVPGKFEDILKYENIILQKRATLLAPKYSDQF